MEAATAGALQQMMARQHGDAAACAYTCFAATMHQLLMQHGSQPGHAQQKHLKAGLTALSAAFKAWAASSATAEPLGQQEVASLAALVAAGGAAVDATAVQQILAGAGARWAEQQPLVWPPLQQGRWTDPLAAAVLKPPALAAPPLPPPSLLRELPLRLQVLLLEEAIPACTAATAVAAAAVLQQAVAVAETGMAHLPGQQAGAVLWRCPVLSWALPCAATALASSTPPASSVLWAQASPPGNCGRCACALSGSFALYCFYVLSSLPCPQVVAAAAAVSPQAAAELAASATAVHPYSLRLWQQRQQLLGSSAHMAFANSQEALAGAVEHGLTLEQAPLRG